MMDTTKADNAFITYSGILLDLNRSIKHIKNGKDLPYFIKSIKGDIIDLHLAKNYLKEIYGLEPDHERLLRIIGHVEAGKLDSAESELTKMLEDNNNFVDIFFENRKKRMDV